MNSDLFLVTGLVIGVFSVPSIVSSLSDKRPPRVAAFTLIASGALIVYAIQTKPGGYELQDIPAAFARVLAMII
ncbi:hypothetical protein KUD11_06850 [Roseovarius sp. LXJ103]|uniref:hypothetical protein n=1 Tax=Roseovarius carneus TaxID=2853164 RepID=UPI000D60FF8A|nr:hypothetical protein [Roseovarius carneus]MBZ8118364.1 hypothetical protein [Roseovarius carneus]PWE35925.1 hypothetical protein DD563_08115 [Pelagicola sp. LXJ1103]